MWLRIPTGRRQTSGLFTSVGDYLNSGKPRKIPASGQIRAGLELATFGLQVQRSNHSTTLPRTHRVVTCHPLSCLPAKQFSIAVISSSAILNVREKEKCFTSFFVSQGVLWKTTRIYLYNKNTISVFTFRRFVKSKKNMRKDRFRGYGPYFEILTIKQPIRDLHSALRIACHIIIMTVILLFQ